MKRREGVCEVCEGGGGVSLCCAVQACAGRERGIRIMNEEKGEQTIRWFHLRIGNRKETFGFSSGRWDNRGLRIELMPDSTSFSEWRGRWEKLVQGRLVFRL